MSRKYIWLISGYTNTGHAGTQDDPWSFEDLIASATSGDTYFLKGNRSVTSNFTVPSSVSMKAWDLRNYGPWRLDFGGANFITSTSGTLYDGVVSGFRAVVGNLYRVHLTTTSGVGSNSIAATSTISNSTLILANTLTLPVGITTTISNCTFSGAGAINTASGSTINISSCVSTKANQGAFITGTGTINASSITYGWTAPAAPAFTSTNLLSFAMNGGTSPATVSTTGGVGYGTGWANGLNVFVSFSEASTGGNGYYGDDYIGWNEFTARIATGLTFNCRGSYTLASSLINTTAFTLKAWNKNIYGPWRIYGASSYSVQLQNTSFYDGVIECRAGLFKDVNRMYLRFNSSGVTDTFYGNLADSTIIYAENLNLSATTTSINNCIFDKTNNVKDLVFGANLSITNCFCNSTNLADLATPGPYTATVTNVTYGWVPPSLPVWSDTTLSDFVLVGTPTAAAVGCQDFPSIIYVDINTSNDTNDTDGTNSVSPTNFLYIIDWLPYYNRAHMYLKGYRDTPAVSYTVACGSLQPYSTNILQSWSAVTYGPWRIRALNITFSGVNLDTGVVYSNGGITVEGVVQSGTPPSVYIRTMYLNAATLITIGSGTKAPEASTLISSGSPMVFSKRVPTGFALPTYIEDNFQTGVFDGYWNSAFVTPPSPPAFALAQYPPGSGFYAAVQNGDAYVRLTTDISGDFVFEYIYILSPNNTGNTSEHFQLTRSSDNVVFYEYLWFPDTLEWGPVGGPYEQVTVTWAAYKKIYLKITRTSGVISVSYSLFNRNSYTPFSTTTTYSNSIYVTINGSDYHAVTGFKFQAASGLPYSQVSNVTNIKDSVIATQTVNIPGWSYDTLTLNSVVQTGSTWSGAGITYSGVNQANWTSVLSPDWAAYVVTNNQNSFSYRVLGAGITIPGTGVDTNYPYGLWGEARTNLGAYYFGFTFDFTGSAPQYVYQDPENQIVARMLFGGATYETSVVFTPRNDTGSASWFWNFGDGNTSTSRVPTHIYNSEGVYTVSLYVDGNPSNTFTRTAYIIAVKDLNVDLTITPSSWLGALPHTFNFSALNETRPLDNAVNLPYPGFSWNTGNVDVFTGVTGFNYSGYATYNTYTVSLNVKDVGVSGITYTKQTKTFTKQLLINNAQFVISPNFAFINDQISMTVNFLGSAPSNVRWNYGDGSPTLQISTPGTSNTTTHRYATAGIYNIILTVDVGLPDEVSLTYSPSDPQLSKLQVTISDLAASFTITPPRGRVPFTGLFTDASVGSPTGWYWYYGDGATGTTYSPTIYHTYTGVGIYNPLMTVYDIYGFSKTATKQLILSGSLDITITPDPGNAPQNLTFIPVNDDVATSWTWQVIYHDPVLGDYVAYTKTTTNPSDKLFDQQINASSDYKVVLTITDSFGGTYVAEKDFTLNDSSLVIAEPAIGGQAPVIVTFSYVAPNSSTVDLYEWDLNGDGTIESNDVSPTYTYDTVGVHHVTGYFTWYLSADHSIRVTVEKTVDVTVGVPPLVVDYTRTPSQGHKPLTVQFHGEANNPIVSWVWVLDGVGVIGTTQDITYTFDPSRDLATYYVSLQVMDSFGQSSIVLTKTVFVTEFITTVDTAVDPSSPDYYTPLSGSGQQHTDDKGEISIVIPQSVQNPSITGFKRSKGPTIIFD